MSTNPSERAKDSWGDIRKEYQFPLPFVWGPLSQNPAPEIYLLVVRTKDPTKRLLVPKTESPAEMKGWK